MRIINNPFTSYKKRDVIFDSLKFLAAIMVIFDHSLQHWIQDSQSSTLYNFIFLTQMPVFMFVAGYFFLKKKNECKGFANSLKCIGRITLSLLFPFITFALIKGFFVSNTPQSYLYFLLQCFLFPQYSLWFLWALFWLEFIFALGFFLYNSVNKRFFKILLLTTSTTVLLSGIFLLYKIFPSYFDSKLILYYSVFFVVGLCFNYFKNNSKLFHFVDKTFYVNAIMISIICLGLILYLRPHIFSEPDTIVSLAFRIVGSLSSITMCYCLCYFASNIRLFSKLSFFGRFSLEIYYIHLLLFLIPLNPTYFDVASFRDNVIFLTSYLAIFITSLLLVLFIKTFPILDFAIFGKIKFKK